jgi:DNA-binding MarR family transcriptional regulator
MECFMLKEGDGSLTSGDDSERMARQGRVMRELSAVQRLSETRLNRSLRPLGLSMIQLTVLTQLISAPDGETVGQLAEVMEINQSGVSKVVMALAERGAVEVVGVPGDARRRLVKLTGRGWELIIAAREAMHPEASAILADLDDDTLDQLWQVLDRIRHRLQGQPD